MTTVEPDKLKLLYFSDHVLKLADWSTKPIEQMDAHQLQSVMGWLLEADATLMKTEAGKKLLQRIAARLKQFPRPESKLTGDGSAWIVSSTFEQK